MEITADEDGDEEEDGDFNPVEEDDSDDDEEDEDYEEDEEEEEEEKPKSSPKKKAQTPKGKTATSPQKVAKKTEDAESEAQEKTESPLKKKKKKKKQQVKQDEESKEEGDLPLKNLKTSNKENIEVQQKEKLAKKEKTPAKPKKLKVKLPSGTTIEDVKLGEGKLAKPGKKVFMYYRGLLASNQKVFDSHLSGKPFMFGLGKGEVIQGWDAGIVGMKVGGKRRLTVPPSQGYGWQKTGPIPPNSTLIFDVELKSVR